MEFENAFSEHSITLAKNICDIIMIRLQSSEL